ncbi:rhamnogalacturonan acetylesterase [Pseudozobellia thermophila]|uniref:Lysophospholipase L1 n=1 Tax=Pseudozobellia thermophila TaxID=192903 RepID=A0A1M6CAB1_9FLAO|nr:rhamnogalacturonan acetylesterase [Pseudozobellia thermophila]SHI57962.1 Lysophospholipase L1 [Pseudozobellia thermophila]
MRLRIPTVIVMIGLFAYSCSNAPNVKPVVYTVGDSTVKSGRGDGANGLWGWGDFIQHFLDSTEVRVENHAMGGTSSRTFIDKGLWDSVYLKLNKGDYVLIQFGHNDDGPINDNFRARGSLQGIGDEAKEIDNILTGKHETVHSYGWYLKKMVAEAKNKGAVPIVLSPMPRNLWRNGKVVREPESYPLWAKQVAEQEGASFVDLNEKMALEMEKMGEMGVTGNHFYERDPTHTTARGAVLAASVISSELRAQDSGLEDHLIDYPQIVLPKKRNLHLVGDSTMADNANENAIGWGVPFEKFVDTTRINFFNHARSGRSSRTFITDGLWKDVLQELQPDDFVLIQFGHNDEGTIGKEKYKGSLEGVGYETKDVIRNDSITETVHTYGWYLRKMVSDARKKGANPIILSLTPRNEWSQGSVDQRHDTYVQWAKEIAESESVPFIDLSAAIAKRYELIGKEKVDLFFPKDHTHTNSEGALFNAKAAAAALRNNKETGLHDYIFF